MSWDRDKERQAGKAMTMGGAVFGLVFSIVWCIAAAAMGAGFMLIFGIPFAGMMAYRLYVLSQMAKDDPQQPRKEAEPWDPPAAEPRTDREAPAGRDRRSGYCPYCGGTVEESFAFCPKCGRRL